VENKEESAATFSDFLFWLATMAAVQFGDIPDPATGRPIEPNLVGAGHLIEVIGMLQEKTAGNLSTEESKLVDSLLYDLRMRFIEAQGGQKRIILEP
jgi:Domain of unknown function (DUF1844)